jgi:hypothetical protein
MASDNSFFNADNPIPSIVSDSFQMNKKLILFASVWFDLPIWLKVGI